MASFNKVLLMGNLTRDPQLKFLPSQMAVCEFGIATNRRFKTQAGEEREEVCFVDVSAFGKQAEVINQWLTKGKPIFIEGRLKFDSWDDKNGGGKRSKLTIVVEQFQFVGSREGEGAGESAEESHDEPARPQQRKPMTPRERGTQPAANPLSEKKMFAEADIPF